MTPEPSQTNLLEHWHEEAESAWLYRVIAQHETNARIAAMFIALAAAAETQAASWAESLDAPCPTFAPSHRARLVAVLIRRLGARAIKPVLAAMKVRGLSALDATPASGHAMPTQLSEVGARHRDVARGGNLRAAVFGVNDGLISNACLIMGVAGAGATPSAILTTGAAGVLAGALSMAAGEYISMRAQREVFEAQIAMERDELARYPEEEIEELALIYHARGFELEMARTFARELIKQPEHALDTLAREELGLNPADLGSPWGAAGASFSAFAAGALLPVLPYLMPRTDHAFLLTIGLALGGLFAVGATLSLFTGRSAWWSGLRMLFVGAAAGGATFALGHIFGVASA